ncbi:MAG TPA: DNA-3-methyladenine glycosylase [Bacteroidales bacterium]|nr:DNA-3-methyladenine glycosylase [Bacteroidales bacterium]
MNSSRLGRDFYIRDVLEVAPGLIGKSLVVRFPGGSYGKFSIIEVEAYRGEEDRACHAFKGRTKRTEIMYAEGGHVYVYFVYGMYWMLNIVTSTVNEPQAILIRGVDGFTGPGRLTRGLGIDGGFYGEDLASSGRIWIENTGENPGYITTPRIGIAYAGAPWTGKPWRFIIK